MCIGDQIHTGDVVLVVLEAAALPRLEIPIGDQMRVGAHDDEVPRARQTPHRVILVSVTERSEHYWLLV